MKCKSMLHGVATLALVLSTLGGVRAEELRGARGLGVTWELGVAWEGNDSVKLTKLITAYFNSVADKDFVAMDSMCTRDFVVYEFGKVWNNDSAFHNIQYHQPFSVKFTLTDFRVDVDIRLGEVRYHNRADFVVQDTVKFSLDLVETAAFRRTASGWKVSMIHISAADSPAVEMPRYYRKYDTVRYVPGHYMERVAAFQAEDTRRGGVVMLGNSITEFGDWKRLLGDSNVVNRGIAGDNTFGILDRLAEVIVLRPGRLYLEAGINDIGQGVPVGMIAGNVISIVQYVRVKSPGTRVFVVSVLPTNDQARAEYPDVVGRNDVVREVDQRLREAAGRYGYTYIDLAARVTDGAGNLAEKYARPDGLHLNAAGYTEFVKLLKEGRW